MIIEKIITKTFLLSYNSHRGDLETCPCCGRRQKVKDWEIQAGELCLDIVFGKHGSAVIITECPKCFEKSWVHIKIPLIYYDDIFPIEWLDAAGIEFRKRKEAAQKKWDNSLCKKCKNLKKYEITTAARITCPGIWGFAESECKKYNPKRKD